MSFPPLLESSAQAGLRETHYWSDLQPIPHRGQPFIASSSLPISPSAFSSQRQAWFLCPGSHPLLPSQRLSSPLSQRTQARPPQTKGLICPLSRPIKLLELRHDTPRFLKSSPSDSNVQSESREQSAFQKEREKNITQYNTIEHNRNE